MHKRPLLLAVTLAAAMLIAPASFADTEVARRWIGNEFQPSAPSKAAQQKELEW